MMIVCPKCHQQYIVENNFASSQGRKVRCSSCQHVWIHKIDMVSFLDLDANPKNQTWVMRYVGRLDWVVASVVISVLMMTVYFARNSLGHTVEFIPSLFHKVRAHFASSKVLISDVYYEMKNSSQGMQIFVKGAIINPTEYDVNLKHLCVKVFAENDSYERKEVMRWSHPLWGTKIMAGEQRKFETSHGYSLQQNIYDIEVGFD